MSPQRLLVVSNRLPITVRRDARTGPVLSAAAGGLATGLRPWHEQGSGLWIGWPGDLSACSPEERASIDAELKARRIVPVPLTREHVERYYDGFANRVLWPLFHYLIDRVPVDASGWDAYRAANEAFADAVVAQYQPGDLIWVHDFQLMLLPGMLRERLPGARIGFFLHIPFPSSEVFRTLPWRHQVLEGLLGADLVGFHTFAYLRHFVASLLHVDGVEVDVDRVTLGEREVRLGVFPMGVDAAAIDAAARTPAISAAAAAIRADAGERAIVLGVDRLDYTKGIPRRLQAMERLLADDPALADRIRYIQIAVPSRETVDQYQRFRRQVEEMVGRINGAYGTLRSAPVHYVHRSVDWDQLLALYAAADVMLVTPLRDGMNLVAKEFVAARVEESGTLVLSELAGAAAELDGALIVNPYDVGAVADAVRRALAMPAAEQRARMRTMRRRVAQHDVHAWARTFVDALAASGTLVPSSLAPPAPALATVLLDVREAGPIRLLLDYDGTLVPFARAPELAAPDEPLLDLLRELASSPGITLDLVSGRPRDTLERWFGMLPIEMWAEHGFWRRLDGLWTPAAHVPPGWQARVLPILQQFTDGTPGSQIEEKSASIAWHYRGVPRDFGLRQAHELRMLLGDALSNQPLEVLEGKKVIEVRMRGVSKALVAQRVVAESPRGTAIVAIGDDRTDEDLFRALPATAMTIAVGRAPSRARFRLADYHAVRLMLQSLAVAPAPRATSALHGAGRG